MALYECPVCGSTYECAYTHKRLIEEWGYRFVCWGTFAQHESGQAGKQARDNRIKRFKKYYDNNKYCHPGWDMVFVRESNRNLDNEVILREIHS